jgi:hypothetical protein
MILRCITCSLKSAGCGIVLACACGSSGYLMYSSPLLHPTAVEYRAGRQVLTTGNAVMAMRSERHSGEALTPNSSKCVLTIAPACCCVF